MIINSEYAMDVLARLTDIESEAVKKQHYLLKAFKDEISKVKKDMDSALKKEVKLKERSKLLKDRLSSAVKRCEAKNTDTNVDRVNKLVTAIEDVKNDIKLLKDSYKQGSSIIKSIKFEMKYNKDEAIAMNKFSKQWLKDNKVSKPKKTRKSKKADLNKKDSKDTQQESN